MNYGYNQQPNWQFALANPAHFIALGCGSGLMRIMPGTWGTLFGWLTFNGLAPYLNTQYWIFLLTLAFGVGCVCCHLAGKALGVIDHGSIVWDEVVAIWFVLFVASSHFNTPLKQLACVVIFRFYDMVKPQPIRWFDRHWKNGFGVMFDDIVAALMTLLTLAFGVRYF